MIGSRVVCADLFDRPETMEGLWDRLIPTYALEAVTRPAEGRGSAGDAEAWLRQAAKARVTEHPAVGRGTDLRITGDRLVGAALEVEATIVHLALFRTEGPSDRVAAPSFASVEARRRGKRQ